jgi:hypothetical protein
METWLPWTERRPRRACPTTEKVARLRVWLVGLAIALAATGAVKADPAGAAGFPLVVNDTADRPDVSVGNGVCSPGLLQLEQVHLLGNLAQNEGGALNNNDHHLQVGGAFAVERPQLEQPLSRPGPRPRRPPARATASGRSCSMWSTCTPNANHCFTVRDSAANGQMNQDFHSREKGTDNPPRLVVTFGL